MSLRNVVRRILKLKNYERVGRDVVSGLRLPDQTHVVILELQNPLSNFVSVRNFENL